jgi:hypothetical protein
MHVARLAHALRFPPSGWATTRPPDQVASLARSGVPEEYGKEAIDTHRLDFRETTRVSSHQIGTGARKETH